MASEPGAEGGPSLAEAMVVVWVLFCVFLVVSMQLGFAMVEVGCCREAHRRTILAKNVLDLCMSVTGFGLSCKLFGPPSLVLDSAGNTKLDMMFFHSVFCATAVTICSGAMAERAHMVAYLTGSVLMASVVYFTLASSAWGEGGLFHGEFHGKFHSGFVYHDFAGSGIVHLSGGTAALVGTMLLGRRIVGVNQARALGPDGLALPRRSRQRIQQHFREDAGAGFVVTSEISSGSASSDDGGVPRGHRHLPRQPRNGWPRRFDDPVADRNEFGHVQHLGFQAMGTFTLWVGWYGFNAGGCLSSSRDLSLGAGAAAIVAWNTSLAASGGGGGSAMYCFLIQKELDVPMICNGVLSGLVAITAGCQIASPTASLLLGLIAGLVVLPVSSRVLQKARIDDPVDAIPVHFSNGLLGVLSVPFTLGTCEALGPAIERTCEMSARDEWRQLVAQAWGALTIIGVTASMAFLVFFLFAVSEVASSLDSKQLRTAAYFVQEMLECADADQVEAFTRHWQQAMKSSPLVAGYLVRYSKDGKDLLQLINETRHIPELLPALTGKGRLQRLLRELQTAERDCSATALEAENWRPATFLARLVKGIPVVRHLTLFRLRVSPSAELSGVGPAAPDGLISVLRGVLLAADKDSRKLSLEGEMLCQEIKALAETIEKNQSGLQHALGSACYINRVRGRRGESALCACRCMRVHVYVSKCLYACVCVSLSLSLSLSLCLCAYVPMCRCADVPMCLCAYVSVSMALAHVHVYESLYEYVWLTYCIYSRVSASQSRAMSVLSLCICNIASTSACPYTKFVDACGRRLK